MALYAINKVKDILFHTQSGFQLGFNTYVREKLDSQNVYNEYVM